MPYEPALDGLRALAILAVIAFHTAGLRGGWAGVDLFFVLSGFLITTITETKLAAGRFRLGAFYLGRTLRLYPALLLMAGVMIVATLSRNDAPGVRRSALIALTYTMNWRRTWDTGSLVPFDHIWSLAIEAQFYLVWPVFLMLAPARRKLGVACALLALALAWRWFLMAGGAPGYRIYNGFDTHCDSLLMGCVLALWGAGTAAGPVRRGWSPLIALLAVFGLAGGPAPFVDWWGITLATATSGAVLVAARSGGAATRLLSARPLVGIGRISYGIYLWQGAMLFWIRPTPPYGATDAVGFFAVTTIASIALAALSYRLVERPILRWRDRHGMPAREGDAAGPERGSYRFSAACAAASRAIGTR